MKIDMSCKNKKSLNLGAFSDTSVSVFLIETKILTFSALLTNSKQRYLQERLIEKLLSMVKKK